MTLEEERTLEERLKGALRHEEAACAHMAEQVLSFPSSKTIKEHMAQLHTHGLSERVEQRA